MQLREVDWGRDSQREREQGKDTTSSKSGTTMEPACMLEEHETTFKNTARSTTTADSRAMSAHDDDISTTRCPAFALRTVLASSSQGDSTAGNSRPSQKCTDSWPCSAMNCCAVQLLYVHAQLARGPFAL